ncbi:MAG: hypothetical protein WC156_07895 [Pedobacter sp.]
MRWLSAFVFLSILNLAGCGSTGNPNAPTSKAPHEKTWVTYHRNDIVNGGVAKTIVDGNLIDEHVIQCKECHGADLTGAKGGAAGPACLDCHVLDPVKFSVMCYSCHGGYPDPVVPPKTFMTYSIPRADYLAFITYSTPRAAFIDRVRKDENAHLKHKTVPNSTVNVQIEEACARCHGEMNEIVNTHHAVVMKNKSMGCLGPFPRGCHTFDLVNHNVSTPACNACHP